MKTKYERPLICPHCGVEIVAYSASDGTSEPPDSGDISICTKCAGVSKYRIYRGEIKLEKATDEYVLEQYGVKQVREIDSIRQQILQQNDPRSTCN